MSGKIADLVSNFLHQTQGYSDDITVEYIIYTARESKNTQDIENVLACDNAQEKHAFASKLFAIVGKKNAQVTKCKLAKKTQCKGNSFGTCIEKDKFFKINKTKVKDKRRTAYTKSKANVQNENAMNEFEVKMQFEPKSCNSDPTSVDNNKESKRNNTNKKETDSDTKHKSKHRFDCDNDESNDCPPKKKRRKLSMANSLTMTETAESKEEAEMARDDMMLRKLTKTERKAIEEDRRRQELIMTNKNAMKHERKQSRRNYRKMRAAQVEYSIRQSIKDEENMFDDRELTKQEKQQLESKQRIKKLLDKANMLRYDHLCDTYHIPNGNYNMDVSS